MTPSILPAVAARLMRTARRITSRAGPVLGVMPALALLTLSVLNPQAADAQEYRIRPGDVLRIEVIEDPSLNRSVLVPPDGRITLPLAGSVSAGGGTVESIQSALSSQLAPNFEAPPSVFVSLERIVEAPPVVPTGPVAPVEPPVVDIHVLGEVANPGKLSLEPGTTMLEAFAEMGGFTPFAATRRIQLRRPDPVTGVESIYPIDYESIVAGQSPNGTATILEGDVFVVPERRLFE